MVAKNVIEYIPVWLRHTHRCLASNLPWGTVAILLQEDQYCSTGNSAGDLVKLEAITQYTIIVVRIGGRLA